MIFKPHQLWLTDSNSRTRNQIKLNHFHGWVHQQEFQLFFCLVLMPFQTFSHMSSGWLISCAGSGGFWGGEGESTKKKKNCPNFLAAMSVTLSLSQCALCVEKKEKQNDLGERDRKGSGCVLITLDCTNEYYIMSSNCVVAFLTFLC